MKQPPGYLSLVQKKRKLGVRHVNAAQRCASGTKSKEINGKHCWDMIAAKRSVSPSFVFRVRHGLTTISPHLAVQCLPVIPCTTYL